ncbi:GAF domain-containing protein [Desulfocicer vacuolatum]|nr:transporter substrate-binding domain-containing protein [Desulfocicer vacuolatum]
MLFLWAGLFLCTGLNAAVPDLTPEENLWLITHDRKVRLAHTPDWPPMDFLGQDGTPSGMVADYIRLIEKKLNFRFKIVRVNSWDQMLEMAKDGTIDVISAGQETRGRREFMSWSTPFLNLKTTIIVKKQHRGELTLEKMKGMKIGVVHQYAVGEFIREFYPQLTMIDVPSSVKGIRMVCFGELDAMITELPNALHIIEMEKIPNLHLGGDTGFKLHHGMGIRKDWPLFSTIIEKALATVTEEEHKNIYNRWMRLGTPVFYQTRAFWYTMLGVAGVAFFLIGSVLIWNMQLKRQVHQRTEALRINEVGLEALLALNERPHGSIREIIEFAFQQMLELTQSRFGYLALEDQDGITYVVDHSLPDAGRQFRVLNHGGGFSGETKGFWGEAVNRRKPMISNDYLRSNPQLKGIPAAHKKIVRYMNVPIFNRGEIVVVAGMGNKESDYTLSDLRQLSLLAHGMWRMIQRKKAEYAMQKSEKRFHDLLEYSPNGIAIVQNNKVVYENTIQRELMGDLNFLNPGRTPRFHQDDLAGVQAFFRQITKDELKQSEVAFRFYGKAADESRYPPTWVTCIATPIDYNDHAAYLLIFIDMTEAKNLEHLLIIQDKMASLGHVSAGIAHEIRNPLSGINIYLGTIEKYFRNPDKADKIDASIQAVRSASGKIESVIKRVMNFAKPTEPRFAFIHINEPVREAIKLTNFSLNKKGINITQNLDDELPRCHAEPHLIEEVMLNLINNAADALSQVRDGGEITISSHSTGESIVIQVADNGPGIPRDLREKIFDPFFTTKAHSTGIGLSLCHRIVTDHKGRLELKHSSRDGAAFIIKLPVSPSGAR